MQASKLSRRGSTSPLPTSLRPDFFCIPFIVSFCLQSSLNVLSYQLYSISLLFFQTSNALCAVTQTHGALFWNGLHLFHSAFHLWFGFEITKWLRKRRNCFNCQKWLEWALREGGSTSFARAGQITKCPVSLLKRKHQLSVYSLHYENRNKKRLCWNEAIWNVFDDKPTSESCVNTVSLVRFDALAPAWLNVIVTRNACNMREKLKSERCRITKQERLIPPGSLGACLCFFLSAIVFPLRMVQMRCGARENER